jgi:WD40-like Beta Propeller Repeat
VLGTVPGASADGSYVYFVANGVLASGASPGDCCNLYLDHEGTITFLASLAGEDSPAWGGAVEPGLALLASRVSSNGRWLAFMSERPLTGYDSRDARTGRPDEEVFLYHAGAGGSGGEGKLVCASCNPTGARPRGEEFAAFSYGGVDGTSRSWPPGQGIAASVPFWMGYQLDTALYQPRYLSDAGRLFFNSEDSLVPTDTNGTGDVYQYEPSADAEEAPPGDTCSSEASTFSAVAGGCVDLISSGTSAEESGFLDASESGSDVFFFTNARLSPADVDSARDVYDAHVCSADFPCPPPPPPPPPACQGDACQSPVQAPDDPTPGSLTFSGPGNHPPVLTPPAKKKTTKKTVKCKKPKKLSHGKCVKSKRKAKKAKQASHNRRASR